MTAAPPLPPTATLQGALRALRPLLADAPAALEGPSLERLAMHGDVPTVAACERLETGGARRIAPAAVPLVGAFLDGVQRSRALGHVQGAPVVFASVAAAVRERVDRQLRTWQAPLVHRMLLAPRARVGASAWAVLEASGIPLLDTTPGDVGAPLHPHALRARALDVVSHERERLERQLAAEWCRRESRWLWVDGGIAGNLAIDAAAPAFGVVKSHGTLYGDAATVSEVLGLDAGERSPVFLIVHQARRPVASWYLRLRTAPAGDPLFGLVRIEVAPTADPATAITAHADRLSAGVLLERSPLALPDARWDTLTYGVYACEQYLQALVGP